METARPSLVVCLKRFSLDDERLESRLAGNPREAGSAIRDAAQRGSDAAQLILGQLLLDGRGVARDLPAALTWFERAAEQGNAEARNMVGRCHERGWGVPQDYVVAAGHFEQAIGRGHVWAKVNLAQILMRLGDPADRPRAYELFRQAAEQGNLKAINSLARFLEEGWVVPADPAQAASLYRLAAERGDHWAKFNLATLLLAAGDRDSALALVADAIARSDAGFRRRAAPLLLERPDPDLRGLGLDALARAAAAGEADDQYRYALALEAGLAGPPRPREARLWHRRAADQGHADAIRCSRRATALRLVARRLLHRFTFAGAKRAPVPANLQPLR
ncbi:sel1 repeat family protein [Sphingomonas gei]|uniref:Sel1 repeat family protein n=2 Tax=Sphingomonas gei TaxID=1395960 RepID=A0A4V3QY67_9SPHN|nr:sel1 repeat family protein [Sphingomonas gei]